MGSALWAGISGLNASSKQLDVIANNLANVNTLGFKSGTTYFSDVLSSSLSGGASGTLQVGRGVAVSAVQTQFGAGAFETTGNATDVAIDGDGFFMVNDQEGATFYTRAGAFHLDADGLMVDTNGYKVQGRSVEGGTPTGPLGDINLTASKSQPTVTTNFSIGANLNSGTVAGGEYSTTQTIYDSLGAKRTLNTTFTRTESVGTGYWSVESSLDANPSTTISANGIVFDSDGTCTGIYTGTASAVTAEHNVVGAVTPTHTAPSATTSLVGGGTGLTALDSIVLTRGATAADWTVTTHANYPNMKILSATATTVTVDANNDATADMTLNLSGAWAATDTASFSITTAYNPVGPVTPVLGAVTAGSTHIAATASATLDRPGTASLDGTMVLTKDSTTASGWKFAIAADKGGYASAAIVSANTTTVNVDLDGDGVTDAHLSLSGTWADTDKATFTLDNATAAKTATLALDRPGMIYQTGTLKLTQGATAWAVEGTGGYSNAKVTSSSLTGPITVSLDGTGTDDVTMTLTNTWVTGDTAVFTLTHTPLALNDITVNYSGVTLDGGATIGTGGDMTWSLTGTGALNITQYSTASVIRALTADGYSSGNLKTLSISGNGRISGFFTNGQTADLAQIMLAQFPNPWGLKKMGNNLFGETVLSGATVQNYPGESGMGSLTPNTLEMSNTDIATEFIKMITAQKAYQANARVVTTQDAIMQELMNLKR